MPWFESKYPAEDAVWIHDAAGKPPAMTEEGVRYYEPTGRMGGGSFTELGPGETRGGLYRLDSHFRIENHEVYTILGASAQNIPGADVFGPSSCMFQIKDTLVSRPFQVKMESSKKPPIEKSPARPQPESSNTKQDTEWTSLAAKAGKPCKGCVLETMMSPVRRGTLIVSLCDEDFAKMEQPTNDPSSRDIEISTTARQANSYRILVRDPDGNPVPSSGDAKSALSKGEAKRVNKSARYTLRFGDGIGAAIPLTDWFNMSKTGEYSVLVTLPSSEDKDCMWVAEPTKVRIESKLAVPRRTKTKF